MKQKIYTLLMTLVMMAMVMACPSSLRAQDLTPITVGSTTKLQGGEMEGFSLTTSQTGFCSISFSKAATAAIAESIEAFMDEDFIAIIYAGCFIEFRCEANTSYLVVAQGESGTEMTVQLQADVTIDCGTLSSGSTSPQAFTPTISGNYEFAATPSTLAVVVYGTSDDGVMDSAPIISESSPCNATLTAGKQYYIVCASETGAENGSAVSVAVARKEKVVETQPLTLGDNTVSLAEYGYFDFIIQANCSFTPSESGYYIFEPSLCPSDLVLEIGATSDLSNTNVIKSVDYTFGKLIVELEKDTPYYLAVGLISGYEPTDTDTPTEVVLNVSALTTDAKAVYTASNKTLTFYNTTQQVAGDKVFTVTGYDCPWNDSKKRVSFADEYTVEKVVFDPSFSAFKPKSCADWFYGFSDLTEIKDIQYLNTEDAVLLGSMFSGCSSLTSLDVSKFNTAKVVNMSSMFYGCSSLTSLDVSKFNTAKVGNMFAMFSGCSSLTSLDVSKFNTAEVQNMGNMFSGCSSLTSLDVSKFNTAKVEDMGRMFARCEALESLDVSNFNTAQVCYMTSMFSDCKALTSLDLSSFNTANVDGMASMFDNCRALTSLDLSSFNTANVESMLCMFFCCMNLESLTIGNFDMTMVTKGMSDNMFNSADNLKTLTIKSMPYLADETFNVAFSGTDKTVNYDLQLNDNSIVYCGTNYLPEATNWTAAPTYTRRMGNTWGTLVLPFEVSSNEDVEYYQLDAVGETAMTFKKMDKVAANTPCVFRKLSIGTEVVITASSNDVAPAAPSEVLKLGYTLKGTYTAIEDIDPAEADNTDLYYIAQDKFWHATKQFDVPAFRAWFERTTSANGAAPRSYTINIGDGESDLHFVEAEDGTVRFYYDLQGRPVSKDYRGLKVSRTNK